MNGARVGIGQRRPYRPSECEVLVHRFGVESGGEPQTLEQIGRRVGVSKERIRQIEARAMSKLRAEFGDAVGLEISP